MKRYYIKTMGNDDDAYKEAISFACDYVSEQSEPFEIILYALSKSNVGWLTRIYDDATVKLMFKGHRFSNCEAKIKIETPKTINKYHSTPKWIAITMGMKSDKVLELENIRGIDAIVAIPWLEDDLDKWTKHLGAIDLRGNSETIEVEEPNCIVKEALAELTDRINMSTGITHPNDERFAKTIVRTFKKYNIEVNSGQIEGYLINSLHWRASRSKKFADLIRKIETGKRFQGGDKTGLQYHLKRWKSNCK